jgi:hypothetical protein
VVRDSRVGLSTEVSEHAPPLVYQITHSDLPAQVPRPSIVAAATSSPMTATVGYHLASSGLTRCYRSLRWVLAQQLEVVRTLRTLTLSLAKGSYPNFSVAPPQRVTPVISYPIAMATWHDEETRLRQVSQW